MKNVMMTKYLVIVAGKGIVTVDGDVPIIDASISLNNIKQFCTYELGISVDEAEILETAEMILVSGKLKPLVPFKTRTLQEVLDTNSGLKFLDGLSIFC